MGRKRDLDAPQKKSGPGKKAKKQKPPTLPGLLTTAGAGRGGGGFTKSNRGAGIISNDVELTILVINANETVFLMMGL